MARRKPRPADTPEGREDQLTSMAYDLAEQQLLDGTASSQVTTHFLKMGSQRERLERVRLENENLLLSAKVDAMASAKKVEGLVEEALEAFRIYSGNYEEGEEDEYGNPY